MPEAAGQTRDEMAVSFPSRSTWSANLRLRIVTASLLIPAVVALAWFGGWPAFVGAALVLVIGAWELRAMFARRGWRPLMALSVALGLDFLMAAMLPGPRLLLIQGGISAAVVGSFVWLMLARPMIERTIVDWALTLAVPFYLGWPLAFLLLLRGDHVGYAGRGLWWLLVLLLAVWANDSVALLAGHYLGRGGHHKLARHVSPNKTWEGFFGGLVAATAAVVAVTVLADRVLVHPFPLPWYHRLILGALIALAATAGDLAKSVLKRGTGVKDSGSLLPGHGGILDRTDSLLFAVYVVFFYASALRVVA